MISASLPPDVFRDLVGKPFKRGGRGPGAYDCWGVLQAVLRAMGRGPTDYPTQPELLAGALADEWIPISRMGVVAGDGILLRSTDPAYRWHIGVAIDRYNMLHAREGVGVCIERIDAPVYARRVVGFYRFRGHP